MKSFFKRISEIWQNMDGSISARRVGGIALIICGLLGWYLKLSDTVSTLVIGLGATLLGITTADPHPPTV
jgi:low affinity Fe/Cu permease